MSISAKCPNGHVLKVKDEYAGKSGLCPHCGSRVSVPVPSAEKSRISDDDILGLLGEPSKVTAEPPPVPPSNPQMESVHDAAEGGGVGDQPAQLVDLGEAETLPEMCQCDLGCLQALSALRHAAADHEPEKSGKARPNIK